MTSRATPDIRIQKLGEQILRVLVARIVNGELPPGSRIPSELEIGAEFGVSKSVARDVVAALVGKRLVAVSQGRRPEVLPTSEWDALDPLILELQEDQQAIDEVIASMQDVRTILEPEIAARAALRIDDGQLEQLREAKVRMRELADRPPERLEADVDFHVVLARATGNRILEHIVESLRALTRVSVQQRAEYMERGSETVERDYDFHDRIYQAVQARDPDAAREAMHAHMLMSSQALRPRPEPAGPA